MPLPKYNAEDQPKLAAISGEVIGAMSPPAFPPVFTIPHAEPTSCPETSMAAAQNVTSETAEHPNARDINATAVVVSVILTPAYSSTALSPNPLAPTIR